MNSQNFQPPQPECWQGREDGQRFHHLVQCRAVDKPKPPGISMLGFCSDEGVTRNHGRPGAKQGPDAIRQALGPLSINRTIPLFDCGSVIADKGLEQAQQQLGQLVGQLQSQKQVTVVLGGGHETAWGHYQGLATQPFADDLAIINIDAHFDLRQEQMSTSGTPFAQIYEDCKQANRGFHYYCFGIQPHANTKPLYEMASLSDTEYWPASQLHADPTLMASALKEILDNHQAVYLTVCLDAVAMAFAPGVSAPSALGLMPWQVQQAIELCANSAKVKAFDCVELAPNLDQGQMTAKLAAQFVATFIANQRTA